MLEEKDKLTMDEQSRRCRKNTPTDAQTRRKAKAWCCFSVGMTIMTVLCVIFIAISSEIKDEISSNSSTTVTVNSLSTRNDTNTSKSARLDFSQSTVAQTTDGASDGTPVFSGLSWLVIAGLAVVVLTFFTITVMLSRRRNSSESTNDIELETMTSSHPKKIKQSYRTNRTKYSKIPQLDKRFTEKQTTLFLKENEYVIKKQSNDTVENVATSFDNISSQQAPNKRLKEKEDTPIQSKTHRQASDANYQLNSTPAEEPSYTTLKEDKIIPRTAGNEAPNSSTQSRTTITEWPDVSYMPMSVPADRCKENFSHLKYRVQVSVVKPLKSGDENNTQTEQNKPLQETDDNTRLDWNKVFTFLAENLPPTNYKIFFVNLYDHLPKGMDIDTRISKTECDFKSGGTTTLIFELFKSWKQILGTRAKPSLIENALFEMNYNDVRNRFQDFMREPPLLPKIVESTKTPYEYPPTHLCQIPHFNRPIQQGSQVLALHDTVQTQSCPACRTKLQIQTHEENRIAYVCHNQNNQLKLGNSPSTSGQCAHNISSSFKIDDTRKRHWTDGDSSESDEGGTVCTYSGTNAYSPFLFQGQHRKKKIKRSKHSQKSKTHVPWEKVDKRFIINLMKSYLPLGSQMLTKDQYNLFMYHTVSVITEKTGESGSVVKSLKKDDFDDAKELKTKRGHVSYTIDSETALLTLGQDEWDCLKLYAEHARECVLKRLNTDESKLADMEYLFIDFNGHAIIEQNGEEHEMSHVNEKASASIADTTQDNSTKTE